MRAICDHSAISDANHEYHDRQTVHQGLDRNMYLSLRRLTCYAPVFHPGGVRDSRLGSPDNALGRGGIRMEEGQIVA